MRGLLRRLRTAWAAGATEPPRLGRWCHPTSEVYSRSCDQMAKMHHGTSDNCLGHPTPRTPSPPSRDPVSVWALESF